MGLGCIGTKIEKSSQMIYISNKFLSKEVSNALQKVDRGNTWQ